MNCYFKIGKPLKGLVVISNFTIPWWFCKYVWTASRMCPCQITVNSERPNGGVSQAHIPPIKSCQFWWLWMLIEFSAVSSISNQVRQPKHRETVNCHGGKNSGQITTFRKLSTSNISKTRQDFQRDSPEHISGGVKCRKDMNAHNQNAAIRINWRSSVTPRDSFENDLPKASSGPKCFRL